MKYPAVLIVASVLAGIAASQAGAQCVGGFCIRKPTPAPAPRAVQGSSVRGMASAGDRVCVDSICLGDGLDSLSTVTWETARQRSNLANPPPTAGRAITRGESTMIARRWRGAQPGIHAYLADEKFDGGALAGLAKIVAACEHHYLLGKYVTPSGNRTEIELAMRADPNDQSIQRWTVQRIVRQFPNARSTAHKQEATAQIRARYGNRVTISEGNGILHFQTRLPTVQNESGTLSAHPACGGNGGKGSASID
ncbi:MAG: hypothetical protein AB7F98_06075 [Novosphingobium sp.]